MKQVEMDIILGAIYWVIERRASGNRISSARGKGESSLLIISA